MECAMIRRIRRNESLKHSFNEAFNEKDRFSYAIKNAWNQIRFAKGSAEIMEEAAQEMKKYNHYGSRFNEEEIVNLDKQLTDIISTCEYLQSFIDGLDV
jgi:hypothetical protein